MRYTVASDKSVWYVRDHGWNGQDCPKEQYPKPAIELRFRTQIRAEQVANLLNMEWADFLRNPS